MFERRLKVLLVLLGLPTLTIVARLVQLQVARADAYRAAAQKMLDQEPRFFPFLRGHIVDRQGVALAYNAECWDISVHYGVMYGDRRLRKRLCRKWGRTLDATLDEDVEASWRVIRELTDTPLDELLQRADGIAGKVRSIKADVARRNQVATEDMQVPEELQAWPVVRGLTQEAQVEARIRLAPYPWVEVVPGQERRYRGGPAIGPILGRIAEASIDPAHDPYADDPLAKYEPGDRRGIRGVEAMAELWLRGRRGLEHVDMEGRQLDAVEPVNGRTVRLTLDQALQQQVYDRLAEAVASHPPSTGASAVVLHVPTREVLAMVSYPSHEPNVTWDELIDLQEDRIRRPNEFRAVGRERAYPPGSIVKPMILAGALTQGTITSADTITCQGYLIPEAPNRWRCSARWGHGPVDPLFSLQHSCNVFYYELGQRMTVAGLARWMERFGLGEVAGTGLREEGPGRLPRQGGRGNARHVAIGQWELGVTPLQAANMAADLASGVHRPVRFWMDDPRPRGDARDLGVSEAAWRIVREGMYEAVNVEGGTAYAQVRERVGELEELVLLGKTGSAEPGGLVTEWLFTCTFPDGHEQQIAAPTWDLLKREYPEARRKRSQVRRVWPPTGAEIPTHGWFIGYLAPRGRHTRSVTEAGHSFAVAVVIEYAGHGGDVAAPVAADILAAMIREPADPPKIVAAGAHAGRSGGMAAALGGHAAEPGAQGRHAR